MSKIVYLRNLVEETSTNITEAVGDEGGVGVSRVRGVVASLS